MYGRSSHNLFSSDFMEPEDEDIFNDDQRLDEDREFDFI